MTGHDAGLFDYAARQAAQAAALQALNRAILAADESVPCIGQESWISDLASEREHAATCCRRCPVIVLCGAAGDYQHGGVWGGVNRELRRT